MTTLNHYLIALGVVSAVALSGCGGGGGPGDPRLDIPSSGGGGAVQGDQQEFCQTDAFQFAVTEFVPKDGASNVAVNSSVRITFNNDVDASSVGNNVRLLINGANEIALESGSPSVVGKSIVLNPMGDLNANANYTIQALSGLRAKCSGSTAKTLGSTQSASFTTGDARDTTGPEVTAASPQNGETLAATDSNILVEFNEAIDPGSVTASNFVVTELDINGNPVGTVSGAINPVGNSIEFDPSANLNGQTYYTVTVGTTVTDLAGNPLEPSEYTFTFRTGGLVLALNDGVVSQIPALGDGLNTVGGTLLEPLGFGDSSDGLSSLDNALLLQVPLTDAVASAAPSASSFGGFNTTTVNGTTFPEFNSAAVAVCDPASVTDFAPGVDCTLALDLGLDRSQLEGLADAFTGGDITQVPALLQTLTTAIANQDPSSLPPELSSLLDFNNGFDVNLRLVDDNGLPVPDPVKSGLTTVLDALAQIPMLGTLFSQNDAQSLVDVGLLDGELLKVDLGAFASVGVLSGTQTLVGEDGVLNLGGMLFDTLADMIPFDPSSASPDDLPLIGDLLTLLDMSNLPDSGAGLSDAFNQALAQFFSLGDGFGGFDPATLPVLGDVIAMLDPSQLTSGDLPVIGQVLEEVTSRLDPSQLSGQDVPLIGDVLAALNPDNLNDANIPVIGDLVDQLMAAANGASSGDVPLVSDLQALIDGAASGDNPLNGLLDPTQLQDVPLLGDLFAGLGGLLGG
ncbi:Ig-like domain-containing protein [Marinobacter sp. C2H3]|uniref:Ig-like domain-containing protein n=1 Tax=Marinobacter sp. C2H3 TaxID=3119003 RepID=UPI00300E8878